MGHTVIHKEFIYSERRPTESCHASTLLVLPDGDVLAAWFGGSREGAGDVAIWRSRRSGGKWSEPEKAADREGIPHWNPVLFQSPEGIVYLFYKAGMRIKDWETWVTESADGGRTWSEPKPLVAGDRSGGRGPVKNKPIVLSNGVWAAPASVEDEHWDAFVDLSRDHGLTWSRSGLVPIRHSRAAAEPGLSVPPVPDASFQGKGVIQPTLWESSPGTVHMLLRSTAGFIYRSDSGDYGAAWSEAYPTDLPNNNSGIDLVRLDNGTLVLVYNPVGANWGARTPLIMSLSKDNGRTWKEALVLENEQGEYSYPAVVAKGNTVYVTYTWKRERIAFWKVQLDSSII